MPAEPNRPTLAPADLRLVLTGVFFTFAPIGCLMSMVPMPGAAGGIVAGIANAIMAGLISVGWAQAFARSKLWTLALVIPAQAFGPPLIFYLLLKAGIIDPSPELDPALRRMILGALALASMVLGYILVMRFTRRQEQVKTRLQTELDVAAAIHRSLVPPIEVRTPRLEVHARSDASTEMGGDLIDFVQRGQGPDAEVDLYLADVSGHGVRAGVLMAMVKSAIRARLIERAPLGDMLQAVNGVVFQVKEDPMFVTLAALRFTAGAVEHALAGHLPTLRIRRGAADEIHAESLPFGIEESERYTPAKLPCQPGDLFIVYTDGLTEVRDAAGKQFGRERLIDTALRHAAATPAGIYRHIMDAVRSHGPQVDDQTLMVIRVVQ